MTRVSLHDLDYVPPALLDAAYRWAKFTIEGRPVVPAPAPEPRTDAKPDPRKPRTDRRG